jgi:hypothetical protein
MWERRGDRARSAFIPGIAVGRGGHPRPAEVSPPVVPRRPGRRGCQSAAVAPFPTWARGGDGTSRFPSKVVSAGSVPMLGIRRVRWRRASWLEFPFAGSQEQDGLLRLSGAATKPREGVRQGWTPHRGTYIQQVTQGNPATNAHTVLTTSDSRPRGWDQDMAIALDSRRGNSSVVRREIRESDHPFANCSPTARSSLPLSRSAPRDGSSDGLSPVAILTTE